MKKKTETFMFIVLVTSALVLSACASAAAPAATKQVTGTVTYLQRSALPSTAVIEVTMSDVAIQDVAAPVLSTQRIEADGNQVPFPYELPYDPAQIVRKHTYAVRATIKDGDKLLFISTQQYPVITRGNPTSNVEIVVSPVP